MIFVQYVHWIWYSCDSQPALGYGMGNGIADTHSLRNTLELSTYRAKKPTLASIILSSIMLINVAFFSPSKNVPYLLFGSQSREDNMNFSSSRYGMPIQTFLPPDLLYVLQIMGDFYLIFFSLQLHHMLEIQPFINHIYQKWPPGCKEDCRAKLAETC